MPNFQFSRLANLAVAGQNTLCPQRGQKIIVNPSKPVLVIFSISLSLARVSRKTEWAVCTETAPLRLFFLPVCVNIMFQDLTFDLILLLCLDGCIANVLRLCDCKRCEKARGQEKGHTDGL